MTDQEVQIIWAMAIRAQPQLEMTLKTSDVRAIAEAAATVEREACAEALESLNHHDRHMEIAPVYADTPCGWCEAIERGAAMIRTHSARFLSGPMPRLPILFTMKFRREPEGYVEFGKMALSTLLHSRQLLSSSPESGGMLVGRLILDAEDVVIDKATVPAAEDQRGRYFYKRIKRTAQKNINKLWEESKQTAHYLGEWHTHPETTPHPSRTDLRNWESITRTAQYEQSSLFFVIVGIEKIRVWESNKQTGQLTELIAVN